MKLRILLCITAVALFMVSCGSDDSSEPAKPRKETMGKRTIIAFANGNSGLSSALLSDLDEMRRGSVNLPEGYDLIAVLSLGGGNPYIAHVKNGNINRLRTYDHFFNLLTPDSIVSISKWIISEYPSQEYATVISGHGSGSFMCKDTIATDLKRIEPTNSINGIGLEQAIKGKTPELWLNIPSFATAMSHLPHQQFIFFDCCCMMTAETAFELRKYTDYIIGAACEVPSYGAPYSTIVPDYALPTEQVGASIINHYNSGYNWSQYNDGSGQVGINGICLSVIKSSEMDNLLSATKAALLDIKENMDAARTTIDISDCTYYYRTASVNYLYDLRSVMYHMRQKNLLSETLYNNVLAALDKAVVSKIKPAGKDGTYRKYWPTNASSSVGIQFGDFSFTDNDYCGMSMIVPRTLYESYTPNSNVTMHKLEWCRKVGWSELGW